AKTPGYLFRLTSALENAHNLWRLEREQASLRESELRFRTLFESVPAFIWTKDREGRYASANSAALQLFSRPPAGLTDNELFPPEVAAARQEAENRVLETGGEEVREEALPATDGARVLLTRTVPLRDGSGSVTGTLSIGLDVTERKTLEAQLAQAQKMEAIGRLAGGGAHDFNNLLTVIGGYAMLVRNGMQAGDPLRERVQQICLAAERAAALTRQLLAFSRRQMLTRETIDLNAVLAGLSEMLGRLMGEDVSLEIAPAPALGPVTADRNQMEQVVLNLAVNARDAMPGGGALRIGTAAVSLAKPRTDGRSAVPPGDYTRLTVSDTGVGMDERTLARIFEPFFTTKEEGKGTGLGLATVFGIVEQSRSHILVWSEPGRGTAFEVYLPVERAGVSETVPEEPPPPVSAGAGTVLLVEDEASIRALVATVLRDGGFEVIEAGDGAEALDLLEELSGPLRLLITDIGLPRMKGPEVVQRVRARRPGTRVLFISGYPDETLAAQGITGTNESFLQKPFSPRNLLQRVQEILGATGQSA
ncbi:MAG: response regulator, partial [Acidobacteria bacterium]|nr:response regulator [Acidobacteriota bacterium]